MPKLLLGFVVILVVLIAMVFRDPPTTLCDIQMKEVNARLVKGFFIDTSDGIYGKSVMTAFHFCLRSNSPGGCLDLLSRLKFYEKQIKTIPAECGQHSSTVSVRQALEKAMRLFTKIAWGEKPPVNKYAKTAWLESEDLGLFCRLKRQYRRLYGSARWQNFIWSIIPNLPEAQTMSKKDMWDKSLFSYPCKGLY